MYENVGLIAFAIILLLLYCLTTKNYNYWKKKKVPHPTPVPLFGNYAPYILLQKTLGEVSQNLCRQFRNVPYFGTYFGTEPALMLLSPDIIKLVFTKDYNYFSSRELMDHLHKETITQNVFFQYGDTWKAMRTSMTPLFSTAKLKSMFLLIEDRAVALESLLDSETKLSEVVGVRDLAIRFAMDNICSMGFGIETGTMGKDPENNPYTLMGRAIFSRSKFRGFSMIARQIWPSFFYAAGLRYFPKKIDDFFSNLITTVFKSRNYNPSPRNDFIDSLLHLKNSKEISEDSSKMNGQGQSKKVELVIDDKFMICRSVGFFSAGFETSAGSMSFTLYELAKNQAAQKRAQEEIDAYLKKTGNKINDDCVTELPFLDACVKETLRMYPVFPVISREAVQGYTFPTGLHVERGMRVHLPVYHIHRDPELFPDPEEYKPERFMPEAEHKIQPYTYFPFGEGPKTCIGMRLAKLQIIPGLITFLKTFSLSLPEKPIRQLKMEIATFVLQPANSLPVKVERRPDWKSRVYAK